MLLVHQFYPFPTGKLPDFFGLNSILHQDIMTPRRYHIRRVSSPSEWTTGLRPRIKGRCGVNRKGLQVLRFPLLLSVEHPLPLHYRASHTGSNSKLIPPVEHSLPLRYRASHTGSKFQVDPASRTSIAITLSCIPYRFQIPR